MGLPRNGIFSFLTALGVVSVRWKNFIHGLTAMVLNFEVIKTLAE